ncbi:MAG: hypothetical protein ACRD5W_08070 [Candidatus Acidiferrales bacterium]
MSQVKSKKAKGKGTTLMRPKPKSAKDKSCATHLVAFALFLLTFSFLLLPCASAQSAFVTSASGISSAAAATTNTFTSSNGQTIIAVAICHGGHFSASLSDSNSNTWTQTELRTRNNVAGDLTFAVYRSFNIAGGSGHTVTVTFGGACSRNSIVIAVYSGLTTTDPFDVDTAQVQNSTTPTSGNSATTTQANELVVGAFGYNGLQTTHTAGSGYTKRVERCHTAFGGMNCVAIEDKNVSSAGPQAADWTFGGALDGFFWVGAFKDAATSAPVAPRRPPVVF